MGLPDLPEADKHLIYGLLLRKKRSRAQERKVLLVVRSSMDLSARIEAILRISRAQVPELHVGAGGEPQGPGRILVDEAARAKKRKAALIVDSRAEVFRLLKKCSLKRELSFSRTAEAFDALPLIRALHVRLIIINEGFPTEEEYHRYFEICRAIEPGIRLIYLGRTPPALEGDPAFRSCTRSLPKPLNIAKLEEGARELLGVTKDLHTYRADSSR